MILNDTYLLSYVKGTLTESEMEKYDSLLITSPDFAEKVDKVRFSYYLLDNLEKQQSINTDAAWQNLNNRIRKTNRKKYVMTFIRNIAAVLLPLLILHQFVISPYLNTAEKYEMITLHSVPGIVTKVVLPDGSEVWLNSQSEISYPEKFTENERVVYLVGEAYFKVMSDPKNRFNVITPDSSTVSAFGTEFNVNAYAQNDNYTVTLSKGNVEVSVNDLLQKASLLAGQKASININEKSLSVSKADTYVETAWKDGKMVFRRENIASIAEKLSKKFGVNINIVGKEPSDYQFTATFTDESLEDILKLLKMSTSIDYKISKQEKLPDGTFSKRTVTIICK